MALPSSYGIDKKMNSMEGLSAYLNGGKGSGNFGHAGRPGKVGGSGNGQGKIVDKKTAMDEIKRLDKERCGDEYGELAVEWYDASPARRKEIEKRQEEIRKKQEEIHKKQLKLLDKYEITQRDWTEREEMVSDEVSYDDEEDDGSIEVKVDKKTERAIGQLENLMASDGDYPGWVAGVFDSLLQDKATKSDLSDLRDYYLGESPSERSLDEFEKLLKKVRKLKK